MNYGNIKQCDIADGEGVRTSLFVSGCTHHCKDCFQPETWDFSFGKPFTEKVADSIIESLRPSYVDGLTVLGGEPMEPDNQRALVGFLERVKAELPEKTIWCYTGDVYEDLVDEESPRHTEVTERLLSCIDILVDGPYMEDKADITLRFRGSANQRILDLDATRAQGELKPWVDDPIFSTHTMD
ncbi:MAG: anaerobic ribonucleoside-triphosphate reductase activating protein [Coriobacteriales bacterium]|jgi:anaerobic ribonucleoside-triphosphate reductase activating protein